MNRAIFDILLILCSCKKSEDQAVMLRLIVQGKEDVVGKLPRGYQYSFEHLSPQIDIRCLTGHVVSLSWNTPRPVDTWFLWDRGAVEFAKTENGAENLFNVQCQPRWDALDKKFNRSSSVAE